MQDKAYHLLERSKRAWEMRKRGMSFVKIGTALGHHDDASRPICRVTVLNLIQQWQSRLNRPTGVPRAMTTRAFKILQLESEQRNEPISKGLAKSLIEEGKLVRIPNCGPMTFQEIKKWAYS